jgi:hypothetical protein
VEIAVGTERQLVHSQDLSRTGMFLGMERPIAVGTSLKLAMTGIDRRRLYTRGTVVRGDDTGIGVALRDACEPADELFGIGLEQLFRRSMAAQLTRPANVPAAFAGDLRIIGLAPVLTMLEQERQTGRLLLIGECVLWIDVSEGRIVDAGMADVVVAAHAAVMMALDQKLGRFEFIPCEPESSLGLMPITHLLLEHARRADESGRMMAISA